MDFNAARDCVFDLASVHNNVLWLHSVLITSDFIVKAEKNLINQPLSTSFQQVPQFWDGRSRAHMLTMSSVSWITTR
jgi:hypothetical protein